MRPSKTGFWYAPAGLRKRKIKSARIRTAISSFETLHNQQRTNASFWSTKMEVEPQLLRIFAVWSSALALKLLHMSLITSRKRLLKKVFKKTQQTIFINKRKQTNLFCLHSCPFKVIQKILKKHCLLFLIISFQRKLFPNNNKQKNKTNFCLHY